MRRIATWVCLGFTAATLVLYGETIESKYQDDPRLKKLTEFFQSYRSPAKHHACDFLAAADRHGLDWRLLPSISMVETGGGKTQKRNNLFGWDSARTGFSSVRDGIYAVAERLSRSKLYRNKNVDGVLQTYNRNPEYARKVKRIMQKVSSTEPPRARWMMAALD